MELRYLTIDSFDDFYNILLDNFPTKELKPYDKLKKALVNDKLKIMALVDNDIIGCIAYVSVLDYLFIEYLVVKQEYQNQKMGTKILTLFKRCLNNPKIVLEVELPEDEFSKRRISFYQKNEFILNEYHYCIPPICTDLKDDLYFYLMTYPCNINEDEYKSLYNAILEDVYDIIK